MFLNNNKVKKKLTKPKVWSSMCLCVKLYRCCGSLEFIYVRQKLCLTYIYDMYKARSKYISRAHASFGDYNNATILYICEETQRSTQLYNNSAVCTMQIIIYNNNNIRERKVAYYVYASSILYFI